MKNPRWRNELETKNQTNRRNQKIPKAQKGNNRKSNNHMGSNSPKPFLLDATNRHIFSIGHQNLNPNSRQIKHNERKWRPTINMKRKTGKCSLCNKHYKSYGNNPEPLESANYPCCDHCNQTKVILERLRLAKL